jgi:hypothetical protein
MRRESNVVENVLMFSDGCNRACGLFLFDLQDDWLSSLKEFVRTAHSLALQRQPKTATNGTELSLTIITPKSPSCFSPLLTMLEK